MARKQLLEDRLQSIATRATARDAKTITEALTVLDAFFELEAEVFDLKQGLAKIDKQRVVDHKQYPEPEMKPITDRLAAVHSLGEVLHFLSKHAPSNALVHTHLAISELAIGGSAPPMLQPKQFTGRRPDPPNLVYMKGALAGLASCKQREGLTRKEAITFIAGAIAPALVAHLSKKTVTPRAVSEWLERYGGAHPPDDDGGMAYKQWNVSYSELTKSKVLEITQRLASLLPAR